MVAAANGHGSVIDDEAVISMTVTTSPRRSTFLQQARWDAVAEGQASRVCPFARWQESWVSTETP